MVRVKSISDIKVIHVFETTVKAVAFYNYVSESLGVYSLSNANETHFIQELVYCQSENIETKFAISPIALTLTGDLLWVSLFLRYNDESSGYLETFFKMCLGEGLSVSE
jgi:hypothetical protein